MGKLKNNPDFTPDEVITEPDKGDEADQIESTSEEAIEEDTQPETATGKESDNSDIVDDDKTKKEEEALLREKVKINEDISKREILLREIVEARKKRREVKEKISTAEAVFQPEEVDLSEFDQDEIQRMEKIMRAKGYVPKHEIEEAMVKTSLKEAQEEWINEHAEYLPDNDPDDILYEALRQEIALYAQPKSVRQVKSLLDRANREVKRQFSGKSSGQDNSSTARQARKQIASAGSVISKPSSSDKTSKSTLTPAQREELLRGGFTKEEVDEMG
jgi:hypothetical protein